MILGSSADYKNALMVMKQRKIRDKAGDMSCRIEVRLGQLMRSWITVLKYDFVKDFVCNKSKRLRSMLKSKPNGGNLLIAINAAGVVSSTASIMRWTKKSARKYWQNEKEAADPV